MSIFCGKHLIFPAIINKFNFAMNIWSSSQLLSLEHGNSIKMENFWPSASASIM